MRRLLSMGIKLLKFAYHVCLVTVVVWNTWSIFQLNEAMTAVVTFLLRGIGIGG